MSGEKSMPTRELLHLGAEVVVMVVGEAVRVVDLKRGRGKCVGRAVGSVRATYLVPPLDTVLVRTMAGELGLGNGGEEQQENRFRDWQCARAIVEGDEESASSPAFLAVSERQNNRPCCSLQRARDGKVRAPICVSCLDDRHPWCCW